MASETVRRPDLLSANSRSSRLRTESGCLSFFRWLMPWESTCVSPPVQPTLSAHRHNPEIALQPEALGGAIGGGIQRLIAPLEGSGKRWNVGSFLPVDPLADGASPFRA